MIHTQLPERLIGYFEQYDAPGISFQEKMAPSMRNPAMVEHRKEATASAVLILLYRKNEVWHMALMKRNTYKGNHSGQVSLPGGKMDAEDASLKRTALRECFEEIGVQCTEEQIIGKLTELYIPISNFEVTPYVAIVNTPPTFSLDAHEVDYLIEMPLSCILDSDCRQERTIVSEQHSIVAPCYVVQNDYVWGATAMILSEFAEVTRRSLL